MHFSDLTICLDMYGCPNRCRHCWLGAAPNGNMAVAELEAAAAQFRPFTDSLQVDFWYREPDYRDNYRELFALCRRLSDRPPEHFELASFWRLVRDPSYAQWLVSLGVRTVQLTLFGGMETTDFYVGRPGAAREIWEAAEILMQHAIVPRLQVFVNRHNLSELEWIEKRIRELELEDRCRAFGGTFACFLHAGSCDGENEQWYGVRVTPEDLDRIPPLLAAYTCRHYGVQRIEEVFGRTEQEWYRELEDDRSTTSYVSSCPVFYIDKDFFVYPNITAPEVHWRLGNLKADGAETILRQYLESRSPAQRTRLTVPLGEIVRQEGDPESRRLFSRDDYIAFLLNRYCRTLPAVP